EGNEGLSTGPPPLVGRRGMSLSLWGLIAPPELAMSSRVCLSLSLLSLLLLASRPSLADEPAGERQTHNVVLITLDGLRWQELFGGADESLMNSEFGGIKGEAALRKRFWRDTPEERREALMPFFWNVIAREGIVYGDPQQ